MKTKKSKKTKEDKNLNDAWNIGWDAENAMAESIIDKLTDDNSNTDDAFFGALSGLITRMERFFPREVLLDHIAGMPTDDEDHSICNDCRDKMN